MLPLQLKLEKLLKLKKKFFNFNSLHKKADLKCQLLFFFLYLFFSLSISSVVSVFNFSSTVSFFKSFSSFISSDSSMSEFRYSLRFTVSSL